jgi:hypothetical protein
MAFPTNFQNLDSLGQILFQTKIENFEKRPDGKSRQIFHKKKEASFCDWTNLAN